MACGKRKGNLTLCYVFRWVTVLIPSDAVIFAEIPFGVAVGSDFSPKHIVVALAEGAQQARQADARQIKPAKDLAVGGMAKLVHTDLIAEDEAFPLTTHP